MNGLSRSTGSALAIGGAVVALVGNLMAPRFEQDDNVEVYRAVAKNGLLAPSGLVLILAFLLTTAGILAIASTMRGTAGHDAAWLGRAAVAAGGVIALAQLGIETFGLRQMAKVFAGADGQNQQGAFWATSALDKVNGGLLSTWTLLFLGIGPILLGVAMLQSRAFAAWLAGVGILGGLCCAVVGVHNLISEDQTALDILFLVGSLLVTVWLLVAGVLMRRTAVAEPA
jgi:hypothetical protein